MNQLYDYIIANTRYDGFNGPQGKVIDSSEIQKGDLIQCDLKSETGYEHTLVVNDAKWEVRGPSRSWQIYISAHSSDLWNEKLSGVCVGKPKRYIQILGWRQQ